MKFYCEICGAELEPGKNLGFLAHGPCDSAPEKAGPEGTTEPAKREPLQSKSGKAKYCPQCQEKRKEKPLAVCACCGKAFQKTTNAKCCPDCREEKRIRKRTACVQCGCSFIKTNGNMRYCPQCREKKRTRKIAECEECGRSFTKTNGNMHYCSQCREKRSLTKESVKKCAPALTLAQICKAAREAGLSYGQYVTWLEQNKD